MQGLNSMDGTQYHEDLRAVYDRLTRLEEKGVSRDDRMARMEAAIATMAKQVETMAGDVRDAKTGLRIGLWLSNTLWPIVTGIGGWLAYTLGKGS
jgi:hypothetical protein